MASSSSGSSSSSASQLLSTLIPTLVVSAIFTLIFLALRKLERRVYEPRTSVETVSKDLQPDESPKGLLSWATHLVNKPTPYLVQQLGADGYFFVRFLFEFSFICFLGCILLWPILFPVNITNGNHKKQLDMLTFGNVKNKNRFFAHVFLSWIFFGAVIFVIYRELVYYTTFRHALQTTPMYDSLLSSRTMLLTDIPDNALQETELRGHFPTATNIWYARDYSELSDKVKERTKLSKKYEGALNGVICKAMKLKKKLEKKGKPLPEPADDLNKYLKDGKKRPTHRLKFLIGKKVDTLEYGVEKLGELNKDIKKDQAEHNSNPQVNSVFMEFPSQLELQRAFQAVPYNKELKKSGRFTGLAPDDIVWANLAQSKWKRRIKKVIACTILTLTIIFWCIPVAVVGAISNINFLTEKLPWLDFINNMPSALMGIITSLLPVVALAILMSLIPPFIKKMGKISGCVTIHQVNTFCQNWFFAFQVVNTFLAAALGSSAASSVQSIIEKPTSALSLLASEIPKSSNFYLSYLCLYGLVFSSKALANVVGLALSKVLGRILDKSPRAKWTRYTTLGQPDFSVLYPSFQLICLIALTYSVIAPLVLGFAAISFFLIFFAFLYSLTYVLQPQQADARGRNYATALFQLFVALYVSEVLILALFVFSKNWACVALEGVWILVTAICHQLFKWKFLPLLEVVPISAIKCASGDRTFQYPMYDQGLKEIKTEGQNYWEGGNQLGLTDSPVDQVAVDPKTDESDANTRTGINEKETFQETKNAVAPVREPSSAGKENAGGALRRFFKPKTNTFEMVRGEMPNAYLNYIEYNPDFVRTAYADPVVNDEEPHIWIPKDDMGLSEIEKNKALENGVDVSDSDAGFDEKGRVVYFGPPPSYEESLKV